MRLLLAAFLTLALPASASAATLTVQPGGGACDRTGDTTCGTVADAVTASAASDTISITKADYPEVVNVDKADITITAADGARLTGAGSGDVLTISATGVKVDKLGIEVTTGASGVVVTDAGGATLTGMLINRPGPKTNTDPLVDAAGPLDVRSSTILQQGGGDDTPGLAATDTAKLADTIVLSTVGPAVTLAGGEHTLLRSTLASTQATSADSHGLSLTSAEAGTKTLTGDSTIFLGGAAAAGIDVMTTGASAGDVNLVLRHVTIPKVGKGMTLDATGARGAPGFPSPTPSGNITATVTGSIIHGDSTAVNFNNPLLPLVEAPNSVTVAFTNSDAGPMATAGAATASGQTATPFGDGSLFGKLLHLRADAPVIDKGGAVLAGESATDVDGQPRTSGAATDMGADEFVNTAPKVTLSASTATPKQGEKVTFTAPTTDADVGDQITGYVWDFGDGEKTTTTGNSVEHTYAEMGAFTAKVAAVDKGNGVSNVAETSVDVKDGAAPAIKITSPSQSQRVTLNRKGRKPKRLKVRGTDSDATGVSKIEISLVVSKRKDGKSGCYHYTGRKFAKGACDAYLFVPAKLSGSSFSLTTRKGLKVPPGAYQVRAKGTDTVGSVTAAYAKSAGTLVFFSVR